MAKTTFATDNALTKEIWEETLYRDAVIEAYFSKFFGSSSDSMVQTKDALMKSKGDKVTFGLRMRLQGAGVEENETLEGNEESLVTYDNQVTLKEYAHAVRDAGPLDRQRVMFSIDMESTDALRDWMSEKIDAVIMQALVTSPTTIFYLTGNVVTKTGVVATAKAGLTDSDKITPKMISQVKTWATTGGNRSQIPLRPIKVGGKKHYVLLIHPDVAFDLMQDSTYNQALRDALPRSSDHPLFTGAIGMWDNVVIHAHENVPIFTDGGGAAVAGCKCSFIGAQSLVLAWGQRPKVVAEVFDYQREHGYGMNTMFGVTKSVFNSLDYGCVGFYVARTQISDA